MKVTQSSSPCSQTVYPNVATPVSQVSLPRALSTVAAVLFVIATIALPAHSQTFTVLHPFTGNPDGELPEATPLNVSGTLYSTTGEGGSSTCQGSGCGTVYSITTAGKNYKTLYSFKGIPDGQGPGDLITDGKGNLYGTTAGGGTGACKTGSVLVGCGTVFTITTAGVESVLYSFQGPSKDGWGPLGGVVRDSSGNLYGTTLYGGTGTCKNGSGQTTGCGTVFKLTSSGTESWVYSFKGGTADGAEPFAGLLLMGTTLYGTTAGAGKNSGGTLFKISTSGTNEKILFNFSDTSVADGLSPYSAVVKDKSGNLYGTTAYGGNLCVDNPKLGCGVIYKYSTTGVLSVVYAFNGGTSDGSYPYAGVTIDSSGNLYGATVNSGTGGKGIIFEVKSGATIDTVLYNFSKTANGFDDVGALTLISGNLYGSASMGDSTKCGSSGCGTVFKLVP